MQGEQSSWGDIELIVDRSQAESDYAKTPGALGQPLGTGDAVLWWVPPIRPGFYKLFPRSAKWDDGRHNDEEGVMATRRWQQAGGAVKYLLLVPCQTLADDFGFVGHALGDILNARKRGGWVDDVDQVVWMSEMVIQVWIRRPTTRLFGSDGGADACQKDDPTTTTAGRRIGPQRTTPCHSEEAEERW